MEKKDSNKYFLFNVFIFRILISAFIGFFKSAPEGVPIARDHDKYLDEEDTRQVSLRERPRGREPNFIFSLACIRKIRFNVTEYPHRSRSKGRAKLGASLFPSERSGAGAANQGCAGRSSVVRESRRK